MFKLILLCIVVCVLNKTSVKCRTDLTSLTCNEEFETYKKINNKSYYRVYDKLRSLEAFNENCKLVNDHNKLYKYGDRNFTLGTNALADLNTDAYLKRYLRLIRSQRNTSTEDMKEVVGMSHLENVPDSFDWRKKGFTTLAHNQQNCGSCYAFSIAESIEGQIFKRTGCTGGSLRNTLRYLQATGGLMRSSDYKYVSKKEKCQFVGDLAVTNVSSWAILPAHNENAIEAAVAHIGPVAVSINAAPKTFQLYSARTITTNAQEKIKKRNREYSKRYRDRLKVKQLQLDTSILDQGPGNIGCISPTKNGVKELQKARSNIDKEVRSSPVYDGRREMPKETNQTEIQTQHHNSPTSTYHGPFRVYEESAFCTEPRAQLYNDRNIPAEGNCLFYSLIKILGLKILPLALRRQLRESRFLQSCGDPENTRQILLSNNQYGDVDCIHIFTQEYNRNACVHLHYTHGINNTDRVIYCHFRVNDSPNFIYLHLRGLHFTPYLPIPQILPHEARETPGKELSKSTESTPDADEPLIAPKVAIDENNDFAQTNVPISSNLYKL
ncbi:cysteine proteinase 7 isoform X2 [Drosophila willistoni]|uniref:cysteine proteinase 7 isoform X2 n=1 Tax=Drosophila willistoni TaxID=7260 RepID=UPI001F0870E4|nr:cysteine proteinase 7 isoform X2 [Drosophila willistoni]